jgi:hypothetical protein
MTGTERGVMRERARTIGTFLIIMTAGAALFARPAAAQSLNDQGIRRLNEDAQSLWDKDGLGLVRAQADIELQKLVGVPHQINKKTTATITRINSITIDCPGAPGVTRLDPSGIGARVPLQGEWRIVASADVHVKGKILFKIDRTFTVNIEVKKLSASVACDLDSSDPTAPKIKKIHPADVDFKLKVTTSSWVINLLSWLTRPLVNELAAGVSFVGTRFVTHMLNVQLVGKPDVVGTGGPPLAPVAPADLEHCALELEREIQAYHMPHGCVVEGHFSQSYTGTWEDSLTQPGGFNPGTLDPADYWGGDSGENTSFFLAALSYRYATTKDPGALAAAKDVLKTTRILITMRGEDGNMNRCVCPADPRIHLDPTDFIKNFQGVDYIMDDYTSRDEYTGIFFGLATAYDLLDDPAAKAEARAQFEMALDYLLKNGWTWRKKDGSFGERWAGCLDQQYAWIVAAYRMDPTKYAKLLDDYKGFADVIWAAEWTSVFDTYYSYYKYGLGEAALHVALRNEQDPVRWQRTYMGLRLLRHYIGHHQNAQFNDYYLAADPSSVASLGKENANLLTRWLRQPRRYVTFDLTNDPTIEKTTYSLPLGVNLPGYGMPQSIQIAKYPIPVEKRISTSDRWSRSPYSLKEDYIWAADPTKEPEGIDYELAYWMARYYRAIK